MQYQSIPGKVCLAGFGHGLAVAIAPPGAVGLGVLCIGEAEGNWIEAVCIGTGLDRATLDAETVDVLVQLTARVIEVNADFLVREAWPMFEEAAAGLAEISSDSSESGLSDYSPEALN